MINSSVSEIISLRNVDRFSVPKPEKKMNFLTADDFLTMSINSLKEQSNIDAVIFVPLNGRTGDGLEIENYCNENNFILKYFVFSADFLQTSGSYKNSTTSFILRRSSSYS